MKRPNVRELQLNTAHGKFSTRLYRTEGAVGLALWAGEVRGSHPLICRLHSSCFTSEALGGLDCDCVGQLDAALETIAREGRGIVFYLLQEGRGAGLLSKLRDREMVQRSKGTLDTFGAYARLGLPPDVRTYSLVPQMCGDLGIEPTLRLMTNNPAKISALGALAIRVERVAHDLPPSEHNVAYLQAKARSGHKLRLADERHASAPPELEALDSRELHLAGFRRAACYSLPLRYRDSTVWFRATGYSHEASGHDRVVLTYREGDEARSELRDIYREDLFERLTQTGPQLSGYRAAIARIVEHGAGSILAVPADAALLSDRKGPDEAADRELLAAHGEARGARRWQAVS